MRMWITDRVLFQQLLQNVLSNACKYTDEGTVTLDCAQDEGGLDIRVSDTGIGIPPDKLERIFDEYYQVDTHGAKRMGVGLGLAIVKEVARLLEFKIRITSQLGRSTEVLICVPARHVLKSETAPHAAVVAPVSTATQPVTRILLVEDNEGVRVATELFLRLEGYETRSASSFAEAEALLPTLRPGDVIVADYHLDSLHSGIDVLQRARLVSGAEVPGVILSGDLPSVVRSLATPIAGARFLSKPVDTTALLDAIEELSAGSKYA